LRLVQIADAAFADAAERSGRHLACRPGCTQCCHGAFAINPLDARRLRMGMEALTASDPELAAAVTQRAEDWLAEFSQEFPGEAGFLDTSEAGQLAFEDFANEAACPALNPATGLCDLYEARPMTCRVFGPPLRASSGEEEGFALCELCFTEASAEEIAAAEMKPPHAEEAALLEELEQESRAPAGETVVAYCLIPEYGVGRAEPA